MACPPLPSASCDSFRKDRPLKLRRTRRPAQNRPNYRNTVAFGDFEWDEYEARSIAEKRGATIEEATSVFLDPDFATDDPSGRSRYIALGFSRLTRILFVVHVERAQRVRIISARRATRSERQTYDGRRHNPG